MRRLFSRDKNDQSASESQHSPDERLNPATCITLNELLDLRRHARKLDLNRRLPARAQQAGNQSSRFRGRGMDYQESRAYQPGDDIRNMDWRVTARAGRPHTKLFQEERERPVMLLVDLSPSLFFASRGALKSVIAARAATLISWAAAVQGDRVGALLFNSGHHELKPRNGQHGVLPLIHELIEHSDPIRGLSATPNPDGLNAALVRLRRIVRPGSLVFLISDFYDLNEKTGNHLLRLRHHNDIVAIRVSDPLEMTLPLPGRYGITDGHSTGILDTQSGTGQKAYTAFFQQHRQKLQQTMQKNAIPLQTLSTTDDVVSALQQQFSNFTIPPVEKKVSS